MARDGYERVPMNSTNTHRRRSSSMDSWLPTTYHRSNFVPNSRRQWSNLANIKLLGPRFILTFIKFALPCTVLFSFLGFYLYEPHIELAFYNRNWVYKEIESVGSLSGCFSPERVSSKYNLTDSIYGQRRTEVQAGLPLRMGMDCYNFAGTIQPRHEKTTSSSLSPEERTQFHTYWRVDLASFGPRQEWMLKSFFATQDLSTTRLILWSNGDITKNDILVKYLRRYPDAFALRVVDIPALAVGTALDGSALLRSKDAKAWVDGDLIRLLLLWNYGGVWVDMDSLLTRDVEPLLEHEFVTQWDCYDKVYQPFNGAIMRFHQHSPYLCEAFHTMATSTPPRTGSTDWGSLLYFRLWKRLVAGGIPPFKILPFCFTDARSCRLDNRLPDPFIPDNAKGKWTFGIGMEKGGGLDEVLSKKIFSVHLHNQWEKEYPSGGWVERLLLQRYDDEMNKGL